MNDDDHSDLTAPSVADPRLSPDPALRKAGHGDHFLRLMLFQPSAETAALHEPQRAQRAAGHYTALHQARATTAGCYLPHRSAVARVRLDSPATDVMTDLRKVEAVTIGRFAPVNEANQVMIARAVRALLVVDDVRRVLGIVTSTDILGEKPIQLTHQRGIRRDEVLVGYIMTPADRLEVIDLDDVLYARVGDVVATLRASGRQHALVVERLERTTGAAQTVCGIFSVTQIARQLGIPPQPLHDIARTFAEIEAAIAP